MSIDKILPEDAHNAAANSVGANSANPFITLSEETGLQNQINTLTPTNILLSGGVAYSGTGLQYNVSSLNYKIQGVTYTASADIVTLAVADPTLDRIDTIYVDDTGNIAVLTGTPAASPSKPLVDNTTQLELRFVTVTAGATTPTITIESIFAENVGTPTEWAGSTDGTVNFASTNDPNSGTISVETTAILDTNKEIIFTPATAYTINGGILNFYIKAKQNMSFFTATLKIGFFTSGGSLLGNSVTVGGTLLSTHGFIGNNTTTYQLVSIPIAAFGSLPGTVDQLRFFKTGGSANNTDFFLDDINIEEGVLTGVIPGVGLNDITNVQLDFDTSNPNVEDGGKILFFDRVVGQFITAEEVGHGTVIVHGKKSTVGTIAKGLPVYLVGEDSDILTVELADANSPNEFPVIGFAAQELNNTDSKHIMTFGRMGNVNTSNAVTTLNPNGETWVIKDILYISNTAGGLTKTRPLGLAAIQVVAQVLKVHASSGHIHIFNTFRQAGLPNLPDGKTWIGNGDNHPIEVDFPGNMARVSGSTFFSIQHLQDVFHSSGWTSGGEITDDIDGTITVAAGTGLIRATNDPLVEILFTDWTAESGANVALTDLNNNFIYVEWNTGIPRIIATITERTDTQTNILLGIIYREGTTLHINTQVKHTVGDHANLMIQRLKETSPFARASGGSISETGTRNIVISEGVFWEGLTKFTIPAFDSSGADTYRYFYESGVSSWTELTAQSQIDNLQYNNGFVLSALSNNRYGVHWVYLESDSEVAVLYGKGDYSLSEAQNADGPSILPPEIRKHSRRIGKIIIKKSDAFFTATLSEFDKATDSAAPTDHNGLTNLQGGQAGEYYHLNASEHAIITMWQPPVMPLGAVLTLGATFFVNTGGAGLYLSFSVGNDDKMFFNYTLHGANGIIYDGSDLSVELHCRLSSNGSGGDTVGLIVDYGIIKDGDNTVTTVTNIAQQDVDVSTEIQNEEFDIILGTMTGVIDAHNLMFTLTRNSTGVGADTYAGNFEVIGIKINKV